MPGFFQLAAQPTPLTEMYTLQFEKFTLEPINIFVKQVYDSTNFI